MKTVRLCSKVGSPFYKCDNNAEYSNICTPSALLVIVYVLYYSSLGGCAFIHHFNSDSILHETNNKNQQLIYN